MTTHVIILAQGQQTRLPDLDVPKQMLELPACGGVSIIERTLCQLAMLNRPCLCYRCMGDGGHHGACVAPMVTVVCGGSMVILVPMGGTEIVRKATGVRLNIAGHQLPDPGNSSLKGIARYLDLAYEGFASGRWDGVVVDQTVVLLGDVVYSWACLHACLTPTHWHMGFVGTKDLSRSDGELWGLTWEKPVEPPMMSTLDLALAKHPPFHDTYQPGQMRRWLWEFDEYIDGPDLASYLHNETISRVLRHPDNQLAKRTWFTAVDDYTRDIDLPEHVAMLPALSEQAAADDREHGLVWNPVH